MAKTRTLFIVPDRCIGCTACSNICPEKMITISDSGNQRFLKYPLVCENECSLCADTCSEAAIRFEKGDVSADYQSLVFPLISCQDCGKPFIPEKMAKKIRKFLEKNMEDPSDFPFFSCGPCRRKNEASRLGFRKMIHLYDVD